MKKILLFTLVLPFVGGVVASLTHYDDIKMLNIIKIMNIISFTYCFLVVLLDLYVIVEMLPNSKLDRYFNKKSQKDNIKSLILHLAIAFYALYNIETTEDYIKKYEINENKIKINQNLKTFEN